MRLRLLRSISLSVSAIGVAAAAAAAAALIAGCCITTLAAVAALTAVTALAATAAFTVAVRRVAQTLLLRLLLLEHGRQLAPLPRQQLHQRRVGLPASSCGLW
jgi:hypothetical protein